MYHGPLTASVFLFQPKCIRFSPQHLHVGDMAPISTHTNVRTAASLVQLLGMHLPFLSRCIMYIHTYISSAVGLYSCNPLPHELTKTDRNYLCPCAALIVTTKLATQTVPLSIKLFRCLPCSIPREMSIQSKLLPQVINKHNKEVSNYLFVDSPTPKTPPKLSYPSSRILPHL